ncbi:hypothetical protein ACAX43_25225 [Paraburkholderia sp. IW21]|uniref:hypothetical protein n=1 Tax=Paraburkholderia sp. IW21 TaxID=3242488 RepID=UPI003521CD54
MNAPHWIAGAWVARDDRNTSLGTQAHACRHLDGAGRPHDGLRVAGVEPVPVR